MSRTTLTEVQNQIQEFWAPMFSQELREDLLLPSLVNKDYDGQIKKGGDTVYVSEIIAATGETLDVGVNADAFNPEQLQTRRVAIEANKRFVASYEFDDLVDLQSQIGNKESEIYQSLRFAMEKQLNDYLYSLVSPSAATPDHDIASVTDFNSAQLAAVRLLAAQAKWRRDGRWYLLADPSYYSDMLDDAVLANSDYNGGEASVVSGQIVKKRFGFNILEDNSRSTDYAIAFHPDFLHFVSQQQVRFKISDQHANKRFGYVLSVDMIGGAALGNQGSIKHIRVQN